MFHELSEASKGSFFDFKSCIVAWWLIKRTWPPKDAMKYCNYSGII
jgi:hypothetical protein